MMLNLNQIKVVELTMKLDLEARKYKEMCNEFEKLKKEKNNEKMLLCLKELMQENYKEIVKINTQIKKLKSK